MKGTITAWGLQQRQRNKLLIISTEDETRGNGQGKFGLETLQVFWCLCQADGVTARS